jgi:hypothetical protein
MIHELRTTNDGKLALVVDATSRYAAYKAGDEIEHAGRTYVVSGIGRTFRVSPRDHRCYVYVGTASALDAAKTQYGTSEKAWAAEDELAWATLRQAGL